MPLCLEADASHPVKLARCDLLALVAPQTLQARVYWQCVRYTNTSVAVQKDLLPIEYMQKLTIKLNSKPNEP